jgi:hypothetical protein
MLVSNILNAVLKTLVELGDFGNRAALLNYQIYPPQV